MGGTLKKASLAAIFALLFLAAPVSAQGGWEGTRFDFYSEIADMSETKVVENIFVIANTAGQEGFELNLPAESSKILVFLENQELTCSSASQVGRTSLNCSFGRRVEGKYSLQIKFETTQRVIPLDGKIMFRGSYTPPADTRDFTFTLKLPAGFVIRADDIVPPATELTSDGTRHIVKWKRDFVTGSLGFTAIAEPLEKTFPWHYLAAPLAILALLLPLYSKHKAKKAFRKLVYPHLIESEKSVIDALEANYNVLRQKELQKVTGFSKAKLSRVLANLEKRGIIQKKPWGNSNKIILVKKPQKKAKKESA